MEKISFKDNVGLVHNQAKQGFKWAQGAGLALDYDDMFQEASLAFVLAAETYDPESGFKFSAYYTKAAFSQFRKTIGVMSGVKNLNTLQRNEIAARKALNKERLAQALPELPNCNYGLRPLYFSHMTDTDGGEHRDSFESGLMSECQSPEEILEHKQEWEKATDKLSPLAQLVVGWLRNPPPALLKELAGQMAHADELNEHGIRVYGLRDGLSIQNIGKFLQMISNVPEGELMLVKAELLQLQKNAEKEMQ